MGYLSQYALQTFVPDVMTSNPWINLPLWGGLVTAGMVASAIIGYRAGRENVAGDAGRSAGIRVFLFWLAVVAAAFLIPAAAGLWSADNAGASVGRVSIGVIALGYILFGIMHRPVIAVVGVGIAAAVLRPQLPGHRSGGAGVGGRDADRGRVGRGVDTQDRRGMTDESIVLNETIHQFHPGYA